MAPPVRGHVEPGRVGIFDDDYLRSLIESPIRHLQQSVPFEGNIPDRREPEEPLGKAMKIFYDNAVYHRNYEQRLEGAELEQRLDALNAALTGSVSEELRLNLQYRLGPFSTVEYDRVMRWRRDAVKRGHSTDELDDDARKQGFWGSNRQLLFGQVVTDICTANLEDEPALHLLSAVFLSPSGGIIGPGTHNKWAEFVGKRLFRYSQRVLNYHSVCHDASGYCRTALDIGVGYTYIETCCSVRWRLLCGCLFDCTFDPAKAPLAGQFDGCGAWERILKKEK